MNAHRSLLPFALLLFLLLLAPASRVAAQETGTIVGEVHDSTRAGPLPEATVLLMGTGGSALSGPEGRFVLDDVPEGAHRLTFFHPRLDELGLGAASWTADVTPGDTARVFLHIPSVEAIAATLCRGEPAVLVGTLRDPELGERLVRGAVTARWTTSAGEEASRFVMTDASGRFAFCGLPVDRDVTLRASFAGREGSDRSIRIPDSGLLIRDLDFTLAALAPLSGQVTDMDSGEPVPGASIRILGTSSMTITSEEGRFLLEDVPPGDQVLEVQHVAFGTYQDTIQIVGGGIAQDVRVRIASHAVPLEGIEVTVQAVYRGHMAGFESRRASGMGEYITREMVERLEGQPLPRMIASRTASFRVNCSAGSMGYCRLESRRAGPGLCPIDYWIDGAYTPDFDPNSLPSWDVEAVEAYANPSEVPARFRSRNHRCGVVVLWTRQGPDRRYRR